MVEEASIFVGYFRRNLAAAAITKWLERRLPGLRRLQVRSRYSRSRSRYCCVTFDTPESAQAALALLKGQEAKRPRMVTRLWQKRDAGNDRRNGDRDRGRGSGGERRRADRRGPRWYTRDELEQLLAQATPGKWQGRARIRSFRNEDDRQDGYVEVKDPVLNSQVKVCEVTRLGDRRLVAAAPELALQCLSLLEELESANEVGQFHSRRANALQKATRQSGRRHSVLTKLYAESLGQRLFLLAAEADDGRFRTATKRWFVQEVKRLETGLRRQQRLSGIVEDAAGANDPGDAKNGETIS